MGIQYFKYLFGVKSKYHFLANNGLTNTTTLILQGCGEQPEYALLTFMQ
jgi:hypothetical protein